MAAPLTITDLFTPLSADQFRAKLVEQLVILQVPADKWRKGSVGSTILTVCSIIFAMLSAVISTIIKSFFLPTATGVGLKALAFYVYGVDVPDATFATGNVTLTNSGGGVYVKGVGEYTALNPSTGATYTNTEAFTLNALAAVSVPLAATTTGTPGNAIPGAITQNVTVLLGVAVTNPASFVGVDAPSDDAIRQLCLNKLAAGSVRGVRTVYAYAIQTATNPITNGPVNINRWDITESSHTGTVHLTVAAPSGPPDPNDLTGISTRIEQVARPMGVEVVVQAAAPITYGPTISCSVVPLAGSTVAQVKEAIDNAVLAYVEAYPIGGIQTLDDNHPGGFQGLFSDGVVGAIASGCVNAGAKLIATQGATDLALADDEVATDSVITSVNFVAQNGGTLI